MPQQPQPVISNRRLARGFTLVELLVVIGIIVVLIGILVPTISKVRTRAYATNTAAQIQLLSGSIQQYFNVFNAYPGALDDNDPQMEHGTGATPANKFTSSELLVMALCGGAQPQVTGGKVTINFVGADLNSGLGPMTLHDPTIMTNKRYNAFVDVGAGGVDPVKDVTAGTVTWFAWTNSRHANVMWQSNFHDGAAPEFVDRFPDAMPILYIRAKPGATGTVGKGPNQPNSGWAPTGVPFAYDLTLLQPYQNFPATAGAVPTSPAPASIQYKDFKDPAYYFAEPADQNTVPLTNLIARQKSGYMLISAGIDRIYETADDITNAGAPK
jgi:prepilin-type N-terminal cleavage/methylation domain-containing protein